MYFLGIKEPMEGGESFLDVGGGSLIDLRR